LYPPCSAGEGGRGGGGEGGGGVAPSLTAVLRSAGGGKGGIEEE